MAFSRAAVLRALRARSVAPRPQMPRKIGRRSYVEGVHDHKKLPSDVPWAIGAAAITIPSLWWILSRSSSSSSHGHEDHSTHEDDSQEGPHQEDHEESLGDAEVESEGSRPEEGGSGESSSSTEQSEESDNDSQEEGADSANSSGDQSYVVGEDDINVRRHIPDPKGGAKARKDSKNAIRQGVLSKDEEEDESKPDDTAAASKTPCGQHSQSGKQEGFSNTDTKHSTDLQNSPEKSKKSDGSPETSKAKGTVDVNRPTR